jgi:DNA (cytosine-5)-methyltransferase 1
MEALGYGLAWRTLDARFFGVPHRRRRVFIVAARDEDLGGLGGERAAEVLIECEGTCGHITPGESEGEGSSTPASASPQIGREEHLEAHPDRMRGVDGVAERVDDREELALSFPSRFGSNAAVTVEVAQSFAHSAGAPAVMRTFESEEMEGEDPLNPIGLDTNRYRCIGNGVVAPVAEFIGRRIAAVDAKYWKEAKG